jgi:hypothetical protein
LEAEELLTVKKSGGQKAGDVKKTIKGIRHIFV